MTDTPRMVSREERDELRRLHETATPGEWGVHGEPAENVFGETIADEVVGGDGFQVLEAPRMCLLPDYAERTGLTHWARGEGVAYIERDDSTVSANARLAAAAHNALPRLLETIDALEAKNARLEEDYELQRSVFQELLDLCEGEPRRAWVAELIVRRVVVGPEGGE